MAQEGYNELDLDSIGKPSAKGAASDIEIVHEELPSTPEIEIVDDTVAKAQQPVKATESESDDDDDDGAPEAPTGERRKLTRSQRLKAQRDAYAQRLAETQQRLAETETRARRYEQDANDGAAIGFELYAKSLDAQMQALRRDFDAAFDSGDREKIFDVQQRMSELAATKQQIERDRRSLPTKPTQGPGSEPRQQTAPTQPRQPARKQPSPGAMEWYGRNKTWFNKDPVMTAGARIIDQQMVADGYAPDDPDYFEELDKRLRNEFPSKLGGKAPARSATNPTIQNRGAPSPTPGKIRVTITQSDREMANHLGISVEDYAREKARAERAQQTTSQYTEIF
jgi:hypothetical protein